MTRVRLANLLVVLTGGAILVLVCGLVAEIIRGYGLAQRFLGGS